jgi:hypothetical protein
MCPNSKISQGIKVESLEKVGSKFSIIIENELE